MNNNKGIKLLTGAVVAVVALLLIVTGGRQKASQPVENELNNVNQAIASQFNDNIRDVSARLLEDERKIESLEEKNKALIAKNESLISMKEKGGVVVREDIAPEIRQSLESLKKELAEVKAQSQTVGAHDYQVNDSSAMKSS